MRRNGEDISNEHGGPLRLVVPHLYAWKSCKWIRGLIFMEADKSGYWEQHGYHMRGDPFREERFRTLRSSRPSSTKRAGGTPARQLSVWSDAEALGV